jgi:uncharacterized glyoxalase superfamily protein PhnB
MQVQPYLFFAGRCEDAVEFYKKAGKTFRSPRFGMLSEHFGVGWMISVAVEPA